MNKQSIAVYSPDDPVEKDIQNVHKEITGEWLPSFACQAVLKSIISLKGFDWINDETLRKTRLKFIFEEIFGLNKSLMVYPTHLLYIRDIIENSQINSVIHGPITLVSQPLAFFLFREFPMHITFSVDMIKSVNDNMLSVGSLLIANDSVKFNLEAIDEIRYNGNNVQLFLDIFENIYKPQHRKVATKVIEQPFGKEEIFTTDEHNIALFAGMSVMNKETSEQGSIVQINPDVVGNVYVKLNNGDMVCIKKIDFYTKFAIL